MNNLLSTTHNIPNVGECCNFKHRSPLLALFRWITPHTATCYNVKCCGQILKSYSEIDLKISINGYN